MCASILECASFQKKISKNPPQKSLSILLKTYGESHPAVKVTRQYIVIAMQPAMQQLLLAAVVKTLIKK